MRLINFLKMHARASCILCAIYPLRMLRTLRTHSFNNGHRRLAREKFQPAGWGFVIGAFTDVIDLVCRENKGKAAIHLILARQAHSYRGLIHVSFRIPGNGLSTDATSCQF